MFLSIKSSGGITPGYHVFKKFHFEMNAMTVGNATCALMA